MIGFVDDTYSSINDWSNSNTTIEAILSRAQFDAQLWSNLLNSTGGALELPKVKYHAIDFTFDNIGRPKMTEPNNSHRMEVDGNDGNGLMELKPLSPHTARKMLGCYKEPTGSNHKAFEMISKNAIRKAERMYNSNLDFKCVWRYYHSMFLTSVCYSFAANSISHDKLHKLDRKITRMFLPKLGFNRNTAQAIVYGPSHFGGLNLRYLPHEQGLAKIEHLLKHIRTRSTEASSHFTIALSWSQFNAGTSVPILESPTEPLPHLESIWFQNLRQFMSKHDLSIRLDPSVTSLIPPQRTNDSYFMDQVLASNAFNNAQLRRINYCRLYLDVLLISDMSTACGKYIHQNIFQGVPLGHQTVTSNTINQQRPTCLDSWRLWRKACRLLISNKYTLLLRLPLGPWIIPMHLLRQTRPLYSPSHDQLFTPTNSNFDTDTRWNRYSRYDHLPNRFDIQSILPVTTLPLDVLPIDTKKDSNQTIRAVIPHTTIHTPHTEPSTVLPNGLISSTLMEQSIFSNVSVSPPNTIHRLLQSWSDQTYTAASDGSVIKGVGTYGWIISDTTGQRIISGTGRAFGFPMTSFRAELFGIYALTKVIYQIFDQYPIGIHVCSHCDNKAAIKLINKLLHRTRPPFPNDTLTSDWDILHAIITLLQSKESPLLNLRWIKGHQDKEEDYADLSLPAQLNCDADKLANQAHNLPLLPSNIHFPTNAASLYHHTTQITSKIKHATRKLITTAPIREYILKKENWTSVTAAMVNWDAYTRAITTSRLPDKFITKFIYNILPTGDRVHLYQFRYDHHCPTCNAAQETQHHLLVCHAPERRPWKSALQKAIREFCTDTNASGDLTHLLVEVLHWCLRDSPPPDLDQHPHTLQHIIRAQSIIGWDQLFLGRWATAWEQYHSAYLQESGVSSDYQNSGTSWTARLIQIIWLNIHQVWKLRNEHRHGVTPIEIADKQRNLAIREITLYYGYKEDNLLTDSFPAHIFYPTLDEHLDHASTLEELSNWLINFRNIIKDHHQRHKHNTNLLAQNVTLPHLPHEITDQSEISITTTTTHSTLTQSTTQSDSSVSTILTNDSLPTPTDTTLFSESTDTGKIGDSFLSGVGIT